MKVGDYVEFAGNIFYVTKDLTVDTTWVQNALEQYDDSKIKWIKANE